VFLSGRIDGVELGEAAGWRQKAVRELESAGYDTYDPTRVIRGKEVYQPTPNEVFTNDRWNLSRSDVVLVNLSLPETIRAADAPFYTIGEMFLAHQMGLPLIVFGSTYVGRPGYEAIVTRSFETLDDAIEYIMDTYPAG